MPAIAALKDTPKGKAKAEELARQMRQEWVERSLEELSQQQGLMDRIRRAIKDQLGENHFSLEFIKFTREEQFELNSQKRQKVGERNLQQQYLENPDGIVAQAVRLLESPDWAEIAAGLTVLTGRRSTEILKTAQFEIKSQWSVLIKAEFEGQQQGELTAEPVTEIASAEIEDVRPPITLEAELVQQPETQARVEEARAERPPQPLTSGLEQKLDKLLDVMTQFVMLQMHPNQEGSRRTIPSRQSTKTSVFKSTPSKPSEPRARDEGMRQRRTTAQTEERINQAIDAIIEHNSRPDLPHDLKWAITINTLKSFVKSQHKIEQILEERRAAIEAHHQVQQLDPQRQNLKHRRKRAITEVIKI